MNNSRWIQISHKLSKSKYFSYIAGMKVAEYCDPKNISTLYGFKDGYWNSVTKEGSWIRFSNMEKLCPYLLDESIGLLILSQLPPQVSFSIWKSDAWSIQISEETFVSPFFGEVAAQAFLSFYEEGL
jgi:hypothetical protein